MTSGDLGVEGWSLFPTESMINQNVLQSEMKLALLSITNR